MAEWRKIMAKIMKTTEQEQALDMINSSLKSLKSVNAFLDGKEFIGAVIKVTFESGKNKAVVDRFMADEAVKILSEYRKATVSKVKGLSKKFAIALDEEDMEILEGGRKKIVAVEPDDVVAGDADEEVEDGDVEEE